MYVDDAEDKELAEYLEKKHSLTVKDTALTKMVAEGDSLDRDKDGQIAAWISYYSFAGQKRMSFVICARLGEGETKTLNMEFTLQEKGWKGRIK